MRKLYWLIIIFVVAALIYVVASKLSPAVDEWMVAKILTPIYNGGVYIYTGIVTNPTWISYIAPWGWAICGVGGIILGILLYRNYSLQKLPLQKQIATKMPSYQGQPTPSTPQVIVQSQPATPTAPVQQQQIETKQEETEKVVAS